MNVIRRRRFLQGSRHLLVALFVSVAARPGGVPAWAEAPSPDSRLPSAPLHEEVLTVPGDPARPVSLETTLFTPAGPGPFPLAVVNHGATNANATNRGDRYRFTSAAYYFLSRGYAVALPMMRGFAGSGGALVHMGCDLSLVADQNGRDIRAVIEAVGHRPDIDASRVVVTGQSFGGWNAVGLAVAPPPNVRGVVSFNAALRSSDCASQDSAMIEAAGRLGAGARVPSLWFYGDNDSVMPNATWRAVFGQYKRAGGRAELVDVGTVGNDSHQLLSESKNLPLWVPKADAFLAKVGLPSTPVYPDYLPRAAPPATHFAALTDVAAVPFVDDRGRSGYQQFLQQPKPRAFVVSPVGSSRASGGYDPIGFALAMCTRASTQCRLYAVNDDVVWAGPKSQDGIVSRMVSKAVPKNVSTSLGAFFAISAKCSSRGMPKVTISAVPAHGTAVVAPRDEHPAFPADHPYAACNMVAVPAMGVTYTPAVGYAGTDSLTIDETDVDGRRQSIRIDLKVSS